MSEVEATAFLRDLVAEYRQAREAAASWKARQDELKESILYALGYDPDDADPKPQVVKDADGNEVMRTVRGIWRGLDQKLLKEKHPHIYAECETSKATLRMKVGPS